MPAIMKMTGREGTGPLRTRSNRPGVLAPDGLAPGRHKRMLWRLLPGQPLPGRGGKQ